MHKNCHISCRMFLYVMLMNDTKHILFNLLNKDSILRLIKSGPLSLLIKKICPQSLVRCHSLYDIIYQH